MYQLILWFDILTFALMFGSFGLGFVTYSKTRLPWLRAYLFYLVSYAAWLLFSAYFFFQAVYLPHQLRGLSLAAAIFRAAVSLVIMYAGPAFTLRIAEIRLGRREWWILSMPVAFVFGTVVVYYATASARVVIIPNGIFNLYLGAMFLLAALRTAAAAKESRHRGSLKIAFLPFLWFSVGAYAILLAMNIIVVAGPNMLSSPILNVGVSGAFCLLWSIFSIAIFLKRMGMPARSSEAIASTVEVPADFIEAFRISGRERDVVGDLVSGLQSKEIADRRCISPRTVDAHIYNIYRKCEVKNRVELLRLMERYRP